MVVGFLFYWGFDVTLGIGLEFETTFTVPGKGKCLQPISRLYGWTYNSLRVSLLIDKHSVMVVTAGFNSGESQLDYYGKPSFKSRFIKFVLRSSGGIKF